MILICVFVIGECDTVYAAGPASGTLEMGPEKKNQWKCWIKYLILKELKTGSLSGRKERRGDLKWAVISQVGQKYYRAVRQRKA